MDTQPIVPDGRHHCDAKLRLVDGREKLSGNVYRLLLIVGAAATMPAEIRRDGYEDER